MPHKFLTLVDPWERGVSHLLARHVCHISGKSIWPCFSYLFICLPERTDDVNHSNDGREHPKSPHGFWLKHAR